MGLENENSENKVLKQWATDYFKHKDIFTKSIKEIKNHSEKEVIVEYKNKKQLVIVEPFINDILAAINMIRDKDKEYDLFTLIVFNSKQNLDKIIHAWEKLCLLPKINVYFVNPDSQTDKRWIICPYTHSKVTDKNALKPGLMSIFGTVEEFKRKKL